MIKKKTINKSFKIIMIGFVAQLNEVNVNKYNMMIRERLAK